jgi:hypothetical protein
LSPYIIFFFFFAKTPPDLLATAQVTTHPIQHRNYKEVLGAELYCSHRRGAETRRRTTMPAPSWSRRSLGIFRRYQRGREVAALSRNVLARRRRRKSELNRSVEVASLTGRRRRRRPGAAPPAKQAFQAPRRGRRQPRRHGDGARRPEDQTVDTASGTMSTHGHCTDRGIHRSPATKRHASHGEVPLDADAEGGAHGHHTPRRRHHRLHNAADRDETYPYPIHRPRSGVPPPSRRRSGRRRGREPAALRRKRWKPWVALDSPQNTVHGEGKGRPNLLQD